MITRIPLLAGLLIAQLLILGVLLLAGDEAGTEEKLLGFDAAEVTSLTIEDGDGNLVDLENVGGEWRLGELPADALKIDEVIESLAGGSASWPVATSASSQSRFEVAADDFQRRVLFGGESGALATLYLGSSPGFRRIHAREADSEGVFSIDFGVHELPTEASDWLDKQLFRSETISSVSFPAGEILRKGEDDAWTLDGQPADGEAATRYLSRIENLSVLGLYEPDPDVALGDPVTLGVQDEAGTHAMTFRFNEAVDEYVLESDRMPGAFTVASYIVEQILIPAADLLPGEEGDEEEAETGEAVLLPDAADGSG